MLGKPVIRGTRISVELILRKLAEGADERAILEAYPHLKKEDDQAAVGYANANVTRRPIADSAASILGSLVG